MANAWRNGTNLYSTFTGVLPANPTFTFTNLKNYIPRSHPDYKIQTIAHLRNIFSYIQAKILESKEFDTWQLELSFASPVEPPSYPTQFRTPNDYAIPPPPGSPESEGLENARVKLPTLHDVVLSSIAGGGTDRELNPQSDATPLMRRPIRPESHLYSFTEPPKLSKTTLAKKRLKPDHPQILHTDLAPRSKPASGTVLSARASNPRSIDLYPKAVSILNGEQGRIRATERKLQQSKLELERRSLRALPKPMLNCGPSFKRRLPLDSGVSPEDTGKTFSGEAELHDIRPLRPLRPYNSHHPVQRPEPSNGKPTSNVLPPTSSRDVFCLKAWHPQRGPNQYVPQGLPRFDSLVDRVSDELDPCFKSQPDPSPLASPIGSPLMGEAMVRSAPLVPSSTLGTERSLDKP